MLLTYGMGKTVKSRIETIVELSANISFIDLGANISFIELSVNISFTKLNANISFTRKCEGSLAIARTL